MAEELKHALVAVTPDDPAYEIMPSSWNASHAWSGLTAGQILYPSSATALTSSANLVYSEASGPRLMVGSTATGTSTGLIFGQHSSGIGAIWRSNVVPTTGNYGLAIESTNTYLNATGILHFAISGSDKASLSSIAGSGWVVAAGTATTDVQALSATQTWNAAGVTFTGWKFTITDTASAAGSLALQILGGAAGATNLFSLGKGGQVSIPVGTAGAPSLARVGDLTTGFYWSGGYPSVAVSGALVMNFTDAGLVLPVALSIAFGGEVAFTRISTNLFGIGTAGASSLRAATYSGMMGTGAGLGNMIATATVNTTAVATTGAGPDILQTYDLPLNSFSAAGKGVHITVWGTSANTAEAKTIILYFGSTAILTNALTASIAGVWRIEADVFSTGTDAQQYVAQLVTTGTAGVALNDVEQGTSAQDDGSAITIKCTGTIGAPSTAAGLVMEGMIVKFHN